MNSSQDKYNPDQRRAIKPLSLDIMFVSEVNKLRYMHYLCSADLLISFSQLIVSLVIFSQ